MRTTKLLAFLTAVVVMRAAIAAGPPSIEGGGGAVASGDPRATAAGLAILGQGGNAVDAAVATALVLAVVFPEAGNLGGGGFAVIKLGDELLSLDFREVAPAAAHRDMYLDAQGEPVSAASQIGPLAAGIPGSPSGLYELHHRLGKLPWPDVVEPARRLAAEGFAVDLNLTETIEEKADVLSRFPETAAVFLPDGTPVAPGTHLVLPDLAATLAAYAEKGPSAITEGRVAAAIEEVSARHGGILTADDLAGYRPVWREPLRFSAYGWEIASMSLPSSGGFLLAETLWLLERFGWENAPRFGAERAHLLAESMRRAYADRFILGDPASALASPRELLRPAWLTHRAESLDRMRATPSNEVHPWSEEPPAESADTTHLSAVDGEGNVVALTTTVNGLFGCGLWVPGAGFFLNNEMDDFAAAPGRPNMFGLVQGEANAVRAGHRMLSSMSPTIAWREGETLALGGRGGGLIPSNTLQVLLNVIVDGDDLQRAIDRPRIHHQWQPDEIRAEPDALAPETRAELERRGHTIYVNKGAAKIHAIRRSADGTVEAGTDPRGPGAGGVEEPRAGDLDPRHLEATPTPVEEPAAEVAAG